MLIHFPPPPRTKQGKLDVCQAVLFLHKTWSEGTPPALFFLLFFSLFGVVCCSAHYRWLTTVMKAKFTVAECSEIKECVPKHYSIYQLPSFLLLFSLYRFSCPPSPSDQKHASIPRYHTSVNSYYPLVSSLTW
jgi:hypothetical protein